MHRQPTNDNYPVKTISVQPRPQNLTIGQDRRKAIDYSIQYNVNRRVEEITRANQKLLERLMEISDRKKTPGLVMQTVKPKDSSRLLKLKNIQEENIKLGERLMKKSSQYDRHRVNKDVRSYEKLKKMMANNRKVKNQHLLFKDSMISPYSLGSRKQLRKMRTQPIEEHLSKIEDKKNSNRSQNLADLSQKNHFVMDIKERTGSMDHDRIKTKTEANQQIEGISQQI